MTFNLFSLNEIYFYIFYVQISVLTLDKFRILFNIISIIQIPPTFKKFFLYFKIRRKKKKWKVYLIFPVVFFNLCALFPFFLSFLRQPINSTLSPSWPYYPTISMIFFLFFFFFFFFFFFLKTRSFFYFSIVIFNAFLYLIFGISLGL